MEHIKTENIKQRREHLIRDLFDKTRFQRLYKQNRDKNPPTLAIKETDPRQKKKQAFKGQEKSLILELRRSRLESFKYKG